MGKRKSKERDEDEIRRKIRKLEKKLEKTAETKTPPQQREAPAPQQEEAPAPRQEAVPVPRQVPVSHQKQQASTSQENAEAASSENTRKHKRKEMDEEEIRRKIRKLENKLVETTRTETPSPEEDPASHQEQQAPTSQDNAEALETTADGEPIPTMPEDFLLALGEEGVVKDDKGRPINKELASRWKTILGTGFSKDALLSIFKKYPLPENLPQAVTPKLNPELAAAMSDAARKRDTRLQYRQNNSAKILSCLSSALTDILQGNIHSIKLIEHISDAAKLAAYMFYQDTQSRKFFALAGANKEVQTATKDSVTDELLFGKNLVEKIKSAHSIKLTSQKIKKPETKPLNFKTPPPLKNPLCLGASRWAVADQSTSTTDDSSGCTPADSPEPPEQAVQALSAPTEEPSTPTLTTQGVPPATPTAYPGCRAAVGQAFSRRGTPISAVNIMLNSLSDNTIKQYDSCLKQWWFFSQTCNLDPFNASVPDVLNFLSERFDSGASYGSLNSTRSALSLVIGPNIGQDDRIKRFMKGVFKTKPPNPKYDSTWDPSPVLKLLSTYYPNKDIGLDRLSKKLVTLLALTTGQRVQTLSLIKLENIKFYNEGVHIFISNLIKTSRHGTNQPTLNLPFYSEKIEICPVQTLKTYIEISSKVRVNIENLIITLKKPYKPASAQTISRWVKLTLEAAGINTQQYSSHSTRHASTSAAKRSGLSMDVIKKAAGWTGNSTTFARFYNRPVTDYTAFGRAICDTFNSK